MESLVFGANGKSLIVGQSNGRLSSWDFNTGMWREFDRSEDNAETYSWQDLALSLDGRILASLRRDNTIRIWDVISRRQTATLPYPKDSMSASLAFTPDAKMLAVISLAERAKSPFGTWRRSKSSERSR